MYQTELLLTVLGSKCNYNLNVR